jgi:predicted nucleic acid-binding protein
LSELVLVDTSVAVPLVVADHEHHEAFSERVAHCEVGLSGHAAFETFSVLTRLPAPLRRSPATVGRIIGSSFPKSVLLSPEGARSLLPVLARGSIAGGAIYDALVGAAAAEAGIRLLSGDRRAADTYQLLDVEFELLT